MNDAAFRLIAGLLEARTGQKLTPDRRWRVETALAPLMRAHNIPDLERLAVRIASRCDDALSAAVVDALLNHETSFFRDGPVFALFGGAALDRLERSRATVRRLSIWSAGCSTGQEAYSVAMLFAQQPERWAGWRIEIVGTDISTAAIATARAGIYSHFEIQRGLPMQNMVRWFDRQPCDDRWQASPVLRDRVRFEVLSLLDSPPAPGRFDAILCRNVLFYFTPPVRRTVLARLASAIRPDGVLMLGAGETVMGQTCDFVSDFEARGLYRPVVSGGGLARSNQPG